MYRLLAVFLLAPITGLACVELSGEVQPGALLWGQIASGSDVFLDEEALKVSDSGVFLFGLSRDAKGQRLLSVEGAGSCTRRLTISTREYRRQRIEGVPQKTVTPGPELQDRIAREQALINKARAHQTSKPYFSEGFSWPALGSISGVYGSQRVYNGTPGRPHYGVDVASPTGTPVVAPASGVVVLAEPDMLYSGGTVIIAHGMELFSSLLHMSKIHVKVGKAVKPGDLVGEIGASGRATGPHLDWRMKWRQHWVDPQLLVPPMP